MMIRSLFCTVLLFTSAILFPWPFTALITVALAFLDPLLPLAVGIFADTLYHAPQAGIVPVFTLYGLTITVIAVFVRSRLSTGPIR